jgi:hypothetical protein
MLSIFIVLMEAQHYKFEKKKTCIEMPYREKRYKKLPFEKINP